MMNCPITSRMARILLRSRTNEELGLGNPPTLELPFRADAEIRGKVDVEGNSSR